MKEEPRISRRRFCTLAGAGGLAALAAPWLGIRALAAGEKGVEGASGAGSAAGDTVGRRVRHWAMAIDLRKCEGCRTIDKPPQCTEACTKEHFVPAGQQWIRVYEKHTPGGGSYFQPSPCMHCENAPCVKVCPVGATFQTDDGIVLIDHRRCIGCRFCMAACPYAARYFNWKEPEQPADALFAEYSPEFPVPHRRGTVEKCMFCAHRVGQGKLPACVDGCPMKAVYFGDLAEDLATNGSEVVVLSRLLYENGGYRYKEEKGTRPRVWYLPGYGQEFGRDPR